MIQSHHLHTHGPEPLYELVRADETPRWISVKDAMPETDDCVLVWNGAYCDIGNAYDDEDDDGRKYRRFWVDSPSMREVTHWMPLPKPPKEEK